jgi:hypothetical protein
MPYLEYLTLYLHIKGQNRIIDGTFVQNDILLYMPQLHSFTFYISIYLETLDLSHKLSCEDIEIRHEFFVRIARSFPLFND